MVEKLMTFDFLFDAAENLEKDQEKRLKLMRAKGIQVKEETNIFMQKPLIQDKIVRKSNSQFKLPPTML